MVCSDIHDDLESLSTFVDYAQAQNADRVIILGDMGLRPYTSQDLFDLIKTRNVDTFVEAKRIHSRQVFGEMKQTLDRTGIPFLVIPGNYDGNSDLEAVFGDNNLHKKTTQFCDAKLVGYGGADANPSHIMLLYQLGEMESFDHQELYDLLTNQTPDICMIHNPPQGLCDNMFNGQNVGTPATTKYILESAPKLVLSGHIHEAGPNGNNPQGVKGISKYQNPRNNKSTFVLNPGNLGQFELIDPQTLNSVRKFDFGTFMEVNVEEDGTPVNVIAYTLQSKSNSVGDVKKLYGYDL